MDDYLHALPEPARRPGAASAGEIELVDAAPGDLPTGILYEDRYVLVVRDAVRFPSGDRGTYLRIFERAGLTGATGVVLLPLREGTVYLRRVFRHATRAWELECPRGVRGAGQTVEEAVGSELAEELGYGVDRAHPLGEVAPNTGLLAGTASVFLVDLGAPLAAGATPERTEAFGAVERVSPARLFELVAAGAIRDGFTLSAVTLAVARGLLPLER
jgi:ADP-ribose pyrophosphatase